jgi:hypothetical protein
MTVLIITTVSTSITYMVGLHVRRRRKSRWEIAREENGEERFFFVVECFSFLSFFFLATSRESYC